MSKQCRHDCTLLSNVVFSCLNDCQPEIGRRYDRILILIWRDLVFFFNENIIFPLKFLFVLFSPLKSDSLFSPIMYEIHWSFIS